MIRKRVQRYAAHATARVGKSRTPDERANNGAGHYTRHETARRGAGNRDYRIVSLSGLDHLFQTAKPGRRAEYSSIGETFSPMALTVIEEWIDARFRVAQAQRPESRPGRMNHIPHPGRDDPGRGPSRCSFLTTRILCGKQVVHSYARATPPGTR